MTQISIHQADDFHCHLRDGAFLRRTVHDSAAQFARVLAMPNLTPPICTLKQAIEYKQRILNAAPTTGLQPFIALYLNHSTTVTEIEQAAANPTTLAYKLYPAGATTNSADGIKNFESCQHLFAALEKYNMPLCIHGESRDPNIDVYAREQVFIEQTLSKIIKQFPNLKIILEHISTEYAVQFVESCADNVAATITAHHLLFQRNHLLANKLRPHYYCLPILKSETDRQALLRAATSGNRKFFLGTDSAPHPVTDKISACGCAGIYTAHIALELYCSAFEEAGKLERLDDFASKFGADFYNLPRNTRKITLRKTVQNVPETLQFGDTTLAPLYAGSSIGWKLEEKIACPT